MFAGFCFQLLVEVLLMAQCLWFSGIQYTIIE
uniref:Uncharacterized protein n=1 Tax=Arundo donax TaxID=35708 RepID=A0A0A9BZQ9_ARUDO